MTTNPARPIAPAGGASTGAEETSMAQSGDRERQRLVEIDLMKLSFDFAYGMDYQQYDELVELFTDDALLDRVLEVHHGRKEISEGVRARSTAVVTRHFSSNFRFLHIDEKTVRGVVYNISYFGAPEDKVLPTVYGSPHGMFLDFHDLYKLTAGGWKFAERVARPVLLPEGSPLRHHDKLWRQSETV